MVLVNRSEGTGTGWSPFVPKYNPRDISSNIWCMLNDKPLKRMNPSYGSFKVIFFPLFNKHICRIFYKIELHTPKTSLLIMSLVLASIMFGGGMRTVSHAMIFSNSGVMGMRSVHMATSKCHFSVTILKIFVNMERFGYMDNR